jgi:hypothetical protein
MKNSMDCKLLLARPIDERDTEYNMLNSSHRHSQKSNLSFSLGSGHKVLSLETCEEETDEDFVEKVDGYKTHKVVAGHSTLKFGNKN